MIHSKEEQASLYWPAKRQTECSDNTFHQQGDKETSLTHFDKEDPNVVHNLDAHCFVRIWHLTKFPSNMKMKIKKTTRPDQEPSCNT